MMSGAIGAPFEPTIGNYIIFISMMLLQHPVPYTMHKTVFKELPDSDIYVDGMTPKPNSVKLHIKSRLFRKKNIDHCINISCLWKTRISEGYGLWPL